MGLGINRTYSALAAQNQLLRATQQQQTAFERLSSGLRIQRGREGPASLVISEYLRAQLGGIQQATRNTQEAYNTLAIAEGGLSQLSDALTRARGLVTHALNSGVTSAGQASANQAELNGILNAAARIAETTRFADQPLISGAREIRFTANDPQALLDLDATRIDLVADDVQNVPVRFAGGAENQAERAYVESAAVAGGELTEDVEFTVRGTEGERTFSFAAGTSVEDVAAAVEAAADETGVNAYAIQGGTRLRLASQAYGEEATVEVEQAADSAALFAEPGQTVQDAGQNATVDVRGVAVETDGLTAEVANAAFTGTLAFNPGEPGATTIAQTGYAEDALTDATTERELTLNDVRGGVELQLGPGAGDRTRFGVTGMGPQQLGRTTVDGATYTLADLFSGGAASLAQNPEAALQVLDQAIADVAAERGRIGAFQSQTLETNLNSLAVAAENVTATESGIRDANMAREITELFRAQLLQEVGIFNIQSANVNAQNALRLLGAG